MSLRGKPEAIVLLAFVVTAATAAASPQLTPAQTPTDAPGPTSKHLAEYGKLPLSFEANHGQTDPSVKFLSRGRGYSLYLTDSAAVLSLSNSPPNRDGCHPERSEGPASCTPLNPNKSCHPERSEGPASFTPLNPNKSCHPERSEEPASPARLAPQTAPCAPGFVKGHDFSRADRANKRDGALAPEAIAPETIQMRLADANPASRIEGADQLPGVSNYFVGNDPAKWRTNVPTYAKVKYTAVYPGIDLVYYGNQSQLEYDFVVAPNANPSQIQLNFTGQKALKLAPIGDLILKSTTGQTTLHKPIVYQQKDGHRQPIQGSFELAANRTVRFHLGNYDHAQPLVIDPILVYSTYLGGSGTRQVPSGLVIGDYANGIAIDAEGNAYVTGIASSANFPVTTGAYQTTNSQAAAGNIGAVFVSKLNAAGTALVYSTYLSGTTTICGPGNDQGCFGDAGFAIAVDAQQNAYIAGTTFSPDFPLTAGAFHSSSGPGAFIAKLNATGTSLVYATRLGVNPGYDLSAGGHGGNLGALGIVPGGTYATSIAVDSHGDAFVTGVANGSFPVTAGAYLTKDPYAYLGDYYGADTTGFVTEMNPSGSALVYSTYLGGAYPVQANAIALDSSGAAYVTGTVVNPYEDDVKQASFPVTSGALQTSFPTTELSHVGFVSKLNPTGTALEYSTFIGGDSNAIGNAIAVDALGSAYIAGTDNSENLSYDQQEPAFPVTTSSLSAGNGFVAKLNPQGSAYEYATYVGGPYAIPSGIAIDSAGTAYVAGASEGIQSASYYAPHTPYYLVPSTQGALTIPADPNLTIGPVPFIAKIAADGATEDYASVFGGNPGGASALAVDPSGSVYIAGYTGDTHFQTTAGALQTVKGTKDANQVTANAFVTKLALANETTGAYPTDLEVSPSSEGIVILGQSVTLSGTVTSAPGGATPTGTVTFFPVEVETSEGPFSVAFPPVTSTLSANGVATVTMTPTTVGGYAAAASYSGDATHLTSLLPASYDDYSFGNGVTPAYFTVYPQPDGVLLNSPSAVYGQTLALTGHLQFPPFNFSHPNGFQVYFTAAPGLNPLSTSAVTDYSADASVSATASKAGTFTWTASAAGYPGVTATGTAVFAPANLTVTLHSNVRLYGTALPAFPTTISGLIGSDTVTVTPQSTATPASPVGTYPVTATVTGTDAPNYNVTVNGTTMTVLKAPLTLAAKSYTVTYGQTPPPPTGYTLTGFANGDTASVVSGAPTLSAAVTSTSPAGFYPIKIGVGTLTAANYSFTTNTSGQGAITVNKAPLTILPASVTIHAGDPLPTFPYSITGFVNGDTQATATTGAPSIATTATSTNTPGRYYIVAKAGTLAAQNYNFSQPTTATDGILTILPN